MSPDVITFFDEATFTASHLVIDRATRRGVIIDPVLDYDQASGRTGTENADRLLATVRSQDLMIDWILETHVHADHLTAAPYLKEKLWARTGIGKHVTRVQNAFADLLNLGPDFSRDGSQFDHLFEEGGTFAVGGLEGRVIATPGHTPACVSYLIGDAVFVGDTIFMPDYGSARCDFPGGDAQQLYQSVQKLYALPDSTRMYLCHDYKAPGRDAFSWETTVGAQKADNIHLSGSVSEEDFVRMRTERDATLSMPRLLFPSVQVNVRAGRFPAPESNGTRYLKIPLNAV